MRDVLAFRNGDTHRVLGAVIDVVAVKVAPQAPGFEPDTRVKLGSKSRLAKDRKPERIPFQPIGTSREGLFHQIPE